MNKNYYLKTTVSIWGEGDREVIFLKYLYSIYHVAERKVEIRNAHGGDPLKQVEQMVKYYKSRDYDEKYALFDLDRGEGSVGKARGLADKEGIACIESNRCFEMEVIRLICDDSKLLKRAAKSTAEAKKVFAEMCHLKHEDDAVEWGRWIGKKRLGELLGASEWLGETIKVIRGEKT